MIELLETPTFVVDDYFDAKNVSLFKYLDFEKIPYEVLELCSADLPYRQGAYYPIIINEVHKDMHLFKDVNPRAIEMAQDQDLILVFLYEGHKNIQDHLEANLIIQMIDYHLTAHQVRIVTSVKPITLIAPYVYFSFAEMDAYLEAQDSLYVDGFCETNREKVFTCNVDHDTAHARLFCASIWYHALAEYSYMNYTTQNTSLDIINSPIYKWDEHWSATATLIDMFGQQLPMLDQAGSELDYYNNAYWNFSITPNFTLSGLSLSKNVFLPMLNLQPFVIVGAPGSLKLLRTMGYRTFKDQVNESYDSIADDESRMQNLFRLVYEMAHFTGPELASLNTNLRRDIQHNQDHLLSSKRFKLITLLNLLKTGSF
jgi:hypothetical protein